MSQAQNYLSASGEKDNMIWWHTWNSQLKSYYLFDPHSHVFLVKSLLASYICHLCASHLCLLSVWMISLTHTEGPGQTNSPLDLNFPSYVVDHKRWYFDEPKFATQLDLGLQESEIRCKYIHKYIQQCKNVKTRRY